ncbi:epsin-2 isoform X4 [Drosophila ficusphila]|uniref:epsin-2 isoform X4 n=1 Tax=Drosophila ficusphila TaxID=30025 RepID=UPI0007E6B771|nr:epsin-2 isoform X4 [Drosophila ficusphila]
MRKQKDDMQVNVAGLRRNIKNLAHNYSDAQVKVREATSNDPWGPSAAIMGEIADLTYNVVAFSEIMQMIWKRLNDHGKNWRHVYKALILLEYLIKTGTEKVAQQCKENIFAIQTLREFVYFEEGKDQGTHVREKAKQLVNLLKDDERLKNERVKALKAKERFAQHPSGFGSDGYIDGPSQRDLPPGWQEEPPKSVSELEMVRPQTAGEEELQLQLAMAMSREEAEQEEAKRRSDDVRLQLALSQSEQDFKDPNARPLPAPKKEEPQSHLLDLLDISLGAASISSPPLGAAGGAPAAVVDPWATPAPRAPSQLSDPWSGTSSPQVDPWNPSAAPRTIMGAGVPMSAAPPVGGAAGNDAWGARTQSPSMASGSSNEGWLQTNGNANQNGRGATPAGAPAEGWLIKSNAVGALGAAPVNHAANNGSSSADPWLAEPAAPATGGAGASGLADPWAAGGAPQSAALDDPWKALGTGAIKKTSPEFDEFDLITNRNKSELSNSNASNNNNNASLLDDMDPLSANYGNGAMNNSAGSVHPSTGATAKKPVKDAHSFLGENSALVNLDNLIKPIAPQTQVGNQPAYNPFSDNVLPPKTNLFQQQQPAVPSINQLKQQAPFSVSMNQDPWAPVMGGVSATSQPQQNSQVHNYAYQSNSNTNILGNSNMSSSTSNSTIYSSYVSPSPGIDGIRNMDIFTERPYFNSPTAPAAETYLYNSNDNNNINLNYGTPRLYSSYAASYSSALSDSLAETPGVSVAPMGFVADPVMSFGPSTSSANHCKLEQNNNMPWIKPEAATNPFLS